MSTDLRTALHDVAAHAPLGTLETSALHRRVRRRRAARAAAQGTAGLGLAGAIAVTAAHGVDLLGGPTYPAAPAPLPADEVASTLPAADDAAEPGTCGWQVRAPQQASPWRLAVNLGHYPQHPRSSLPVGVTVQTTTSEQMPAPARVAAVRDGVVVATSADAFDTGSSLAPGTTSGSHHLALVACGGPDDHLALPDGSYTLHAVLADPGTGEVLALSPGEPLVVAGNARAPWCGAGVGVVPEGDGTLEVGGTVGADGRSADLTLTWGAGERGWEGDEEALLLDERVVLVDAAGRIVGDSRTWSEETSSVAGTLAAGRTTSISVQWTTASCSGDALPAGSYTAYALVTLAPTGAEGVTSNLLGVGRLGGEVVVP